MDAREALRLIEGAVPSGPAVWADFGAGDGTFTRALATRLGPGARLYAVDRDVHTLRSLAGDGVTVVRADLEQPFELPDAHAGSLDGMLIANTLHYIRDGAGALARLAGWLKPEGRVVLIEYDQRESTRWVPYPIDAAAVPALFADAALTPPTFVARAESAFGGEMYVAVGRRR
jgi:ubiquinone/menaquinone biosynthesis C-methylase UbiE